MTITNFTVSRVTPNTAITTVYDIAQMVSKIQWVTDMNFSAGQLNFYIKNASGFKLQLGDMIDFHWDNTKVFHGRVFDIQYDRTEVFQVLAYDSMRFLKNEDTLVFPVATARQRFERIMQTFGASGSNLAIPYHSVSDDGYKLPAEVCDGKTYWDMISSAINTVEQATNQEYFLRANYDTVEFVGAKDTQTNILLGDNSLVGDFTFELNLDNLYNAVKVVRSDSQANNRTSYTTQEAAAANSIDLYGKLQKVESADSNENSAQMQAKATALLAQLNRVQDIITLTGAVGNINIRAGQRFFLYMDKLNNIGYGQQEAIADTVTHYFDAAWTMDVKGRWYNGAN